MFKKTLLGLALSTACVVTALPVQAESFDMKDMTCANLLAADAETAGVLLFWMDGYLSGITDDTTVDPAYLETFAKDMRESCGKSPDAKVLEVAKIMGTENANEK